MAGSWAPQTVAAVENRYQVEKKLGEGGAGAVYLVRDRETGEQLALKKLFRVDAKSVLRLKREFRSMQAIKHPHLIKLYDMGQAGDSWFLTMEYLDGPDLQRYLNPDKRISANLARPVSADDVCGPRLVSAFRQLARGMHALHEAGMLHRDLKPSNVLVVDHRVVVLDFGLVRELSLSAATVTEDGAVAGTPAYMAPEQLAARELSAATDWYAFGVMLYEAVSGLLPIDGPLLHLLRDKLESDPIPLERVVPEVPPWVSTLCAGLLQRDPAARPCGSEILASFDAAQRVATQRVSVVPPTSTDSIFQTEAETRGAPSQLFGRAQELKRLWRALGEAEQGSAVTVHVRGASGAGKSALVETFLDQLDAQGSAAGSRDALLLRSRCYELEAMPFKALDGVMDALTSHLSHLDDIDVAHLLPPEVSALAQVFPVLERLKAVQRLTATQKPTQDLLQRRRRAEIALRTLLDNLAARAPIVLWIDDLQWGDLDSARILRGWLSRPSQTPIMFVFSYRSDEIATSTCLLQLLQEEAGPSPTPEHMIDVAPLESADIKALCEQRLSATTPGRADLVARVVHEAHGSPFLALQLLALVHAKSARGDTDLQSLSIDLMVAQTSTLVGADGLALLSVLAVAGRPMAPKLALQAAGVKRGGRALVHDLRALNLVRTRDVAGVRMVEVYHDRIRERVQSALASDAARAMHERLFDALEFSGQAEPDWLHALALGAGRVSQALHYGHAAAERANASLAFERAAGAYRKCVELVPAAEAGELWSKLALSLARCGRGFEAAEAWLAAAEHAPADKRVSLLQRAASHFLRSGHFEQGEALVREVLAAKKISVPTSDAGLDAAIAWERGLIKLRGTSDNLRPGPDHSKELLERYDLLMGLYLDTNLYTPRRSMLFQLRALRCALEAGEPTRLLRALSTASVVAGQYRSAAEADALLARAARISEKLPVPDHQTIAVTQAANAFSLGRPQGVFAPSSEAGRLFRSDAQEDPGGNYQRRFVVASMRISVSQFFGEYGPCDAELKSLAEEALATDNRGLSILLTRNQMVAEQVAGHGARARARLEAQASELPANCFGVLHLIHMVSVMSTACWVRDYAWAHAFLERAWPRFLDSPVRRHGYLGVLAYAGHAQLFLNEHVAWRRGGSDSRAGSDARVSIVDRDVRRLSKLSLPWAAAFADRYRARIALLAGDRVRAVAHLRASTAIFEAARMAHEIARDQYALGALLEGDEGTALRAAAEQRMRAMGVCDPQADLSVQYPELFEVG